MHARVVLNKARICHETLEAGVKPVWKPALPRLIGVVSSGYTVYTDGGDLFHYSETKAGRLLAVIVTWRGEQIRVVTAYDLDADQKRSYLNRRSAEQL
jgi:hypothetical protein